MYMNHNAYNMYDDSSDYFEGLVKVPERAIEKTKELLFFLSCKINKKYTKTSFSNYARLMRSYAVAGVGEAEEEYINHEKEF